MRVIVVHNPTAGENDVTKDVLLAALHDAGHETVYYSTTDEHLAERVQETGDVFLAAGGDGTVRKVALTLASRDTPILVLPMGTANNVGRMLGMPDDACEVIAALPALREVPFDIGWVRGEWGNRRFIEAVGFGVFAETMAVAKSHAPAELARTLGAEAEITRDVRLLKALLALHKPCACRIEIDDDVLDANVLLLEVMNIATIGPNLRFAPDADSADGAFDVIVATEETRAELAAYLEDRIDGRTTSVPQLLRRRTGRLRVTWNSPLAHVDDKRWVAADGLPAPHSFEFEVEPGARRFLVP